MQSLKHWTTIQCLVRCLFVCLLLVVVVVVAVGRGWLLVVGGWWWWHVVFEFGFGFG